MNERVLFDSYLRPAIKEYKFQTLTPNLVNSTWDLIWDVLADRAPGYRFKTPLCDRSGPELNQLRREGREVLLPPDEIMTPEGLIVLGKFLPHKYAPNGILWPISSILEIQNFDKLGGTIDIEMGNDKNSNLSQGEFSRLIEKQGKKGQRLQTYILGSFFNNLLNGSYFDSNFSASRLTGSLYKGHAIGALSSDEGNIVILPNLDSGIALPHISGRTEGRKSI